MRVDASNPKTLFEHTHAPGAVSRPARCTHEPHGHARSPACRLSLHRPSAALDDGESSVLSVPSTRSVGLLSRLADLNPLPPKVRLEVVQRVYRLERRVTTGNIIDIVF
ncbi:MAG: hypothetical protein Kow0022_02950 [Phycisphaerales bacterium]